MTDRSSERDLELDAIDEAFKRSIAQAYVDLNTYGVEPIKTFEDAQHQARITVGLARIARKTAITIVSGTT